MASWKKVLVSGSSIEVNQITASGVPTVTGEQNLLAYTSDGGIKQIAQSDIAGTNPTFNIEAVSGSTFTSGAFDTGDDYLIFSASDAHGFGFTHTVSGNTSSINLESPQDLKTTASPTFEGLKISTSIAHDGDTDTKINFTTDQINFLAGNIDFLHLKESTQNEVNINEGSNDIDFRVEGSSDANLLFTDAGEDKVAIGTDTVDTSSLLTVDGNINVGGITGSFPQNPGDAKHMLVIANRGGQSGRVEFRDISTDIGAATASFSASIVGTANEVEVIAPSPGGIQIGLTDNVTIPDSLTVTNDLDLTGGDITVAGNISASGDITASNLIIDNDIALGGNIFSFSGFSFIEGVSANFSGSNKFGSGSTPAANDIAGGGVAHQFTGSVEITGSGLTVVGGSITATEGGVTATSGTGSFGYLTANEISSSGLLFASLSNDDTAITDGVVVYDNETGQFFTTSSTSVGVTSYPDLNDIPLNIVSASSLSTGDSQGQYDFTVNGVVQNDNIASGLTTSDSPTFTNLTLSGNTGIAGSASIAGKISGSSALFASLSLDSSNYNTVMYDTAAGKFYYTGSYQVTPVTTYDDLSSIPSNIVSASLFSSNNQGAITSSINSVSSSFDVGLTITDNPTFNNLTLTNDLTVANDVTITGDLFVEGDTTSINTSNLTVEDTFILLASGSQNADNTSPNDGGIIVEQSTAGTGTALFWDTSAQIWAIDLAGASAAGNTATSDVNVVSVELNTGGAPSSTSTPILGSDNTSTGGRLGQLYVDTTDDFGIYVYV